MNRKLLLIPVLAAAFTAACDLMVFDTPPFIITKPVSETAARQHYFSYAGITFEFMNTTETAVKNITVSFSLFDAKTGRNPFMGSNIFEITTACEIQPDEIRKIILSLDSYIHIKPSEPFLIDNFCVREIQYSNGNVWQDRYGIFTGGVLK